MRIQTLALLSLLFLAPSMAKSEEVVLFTVDVKLRGTGVEALDVAIDCDLEPPLSLDISIPVDSSRTVTVPAPADREMTCLLNAQPLPGHQLSFLGDGGSIFDADSPGCRFTGIRRGHSNFCQVEVEKQETSLTVFKRWIGASKKEQDVDVFLDCGEGRSYRALSINAGEPESWRVDVGLADGLVCSVSEEDSDSWISDTGDCRNLLILPGAREECTVVNTKVVKMIEMLNRYGLVVMILVFMIVGGFAARRII